MISFFELLHIYRWSLPASVIVAAVLALIGAQWTARGKSAQIFVLGQGSSLGIVMGLALNIFLDSDFHFLNLAFGLSLGWLTLLASDRFAEGKAERNHLYLTLFVFFLSLTYLLTSLTPALESHMAASYFGDIAVMSDGAAQICLAAGLIFGGFILYYWRMLSAISFQLANASFIRRNWQNRIFDIATLLLTTLAIQSMGYLFTIGALFIGTSFAAHRSADLRSYTQKVVFISAAGTLLGFIVSLISTTLPTVPCVIVGQILIGIFSYVKK